MEHARTDAFVEPSRRANIYGVIACQGDSLTFGSRDPDGMSYAVYLARMLSTRHQQTWVTVSFGGPGDCWAEIWLGNYPDLLSVPEAGAFCLGVGPCVPWQE